MTEHESDPSKSIDAWLALASYQPKIIASIVYRNCVEAVSLARKLAEKI